MRNAIDILKGELEVLICLHEDVYRDIEKKIMYEVGIDDLKDAISVLELEIERRELEWI